MPVTKREEVTKQGFLGTWKNTPSSGKSLISTYSISISISLPLKSISEFSGAASSMSDIGEWGGGGRLFEVGAYSNKYGLNKAHLLASR